MAKKISQMTEATTIKSGDISIVVQDGETKQFPLDLLSTKAQADEYKAGVETQLTDYEQEITDIKNQYDKELYTPTITVTNTSVVKTGQGDTLDYSASVEDGVVKSAILKGQTLVNVIDYGKPMNSDITKDNDTLTITSPNGAMWCYSGYPLIGVSYEKKYRLMWDSLTYTHHDSHGAEQIIGVYSVDSTNNTQVTIRYNINDNSNYFDFTIPSNAKIEDVSIRIHASTYTGEQGDTTIVKGLKVLEYQEGMENWDIPYFEGMQSVKMHVLTTTGKNLFDGKNPSFIQSNTIYSFDNNTMSFMRNGGSTQGRVAFQKLLKGTYTITLNFTKTPQSSNFKLMSCDEITSSTRVNSVKINEWYNKTGKQQITFTLKSDKVIYFETDFSGDNFLIQNIQIEEGSTATTYEPYKSNILHTPEEVVLRKVNGVKDTLNLNTGEYVQRTKEVVLNGSENWGLNKSLGDGSFYQFVVNMVQAKKVAQQLVVCDKLVSAPNESINNIIWIYDGTTMVIHSSCRNVDELKTWLQQNPLTVQYELATPIVKTVVLNPSGTLASETPYMWKNGSIQLSSDGLVPGLDYAVTTSRVGVIENNMSETITNEKRIHALEVILAQSTIAAATDAVSLQSDLESTTMSTDGANLETENTQDDFLYEMILLLIENNANDESLFDKVCMFYLYGKLSDEQFTNIYNLLYVEDVE